MVCEDRHYRFVRSLCPFCNNVLSPLHIYITIFKLSILLSIVYVSNCKYRFVLKKKLNQKRLSFARFFKFLFIPIWLIIIFCQKWLKLSMELWLVCFSGADFFGYFKQFSFTVYCCCEYLRHCRFIFQQNQVDPTRRLLNKL